MNARHTPAAFEAGGKHFATVSRATEENSPLLRNLARRKAQRAQLLAALQAIVAECDGKAAPYSGDSYLPLHLLDAARVAVANAIGSAE